MTRRCLAIVATLALSGQAVPEAPTSQAASANSVAVSCSNAVEALLGSVRDDFTRDTGYGLRFSCGLAASVLERVRGGDKLATPLRSCGCFPVEIVEMIEVAEESNNLENVLLESADSLEAQTTRQLDLAVRLLEPALLMMMAAATLTVVIALLLPIFRMSSAIG